MTIIGLDLSTQGLKCTIYNGLKKIQTESINFDKDLSHYNTTNGYHKSECGLYITSPSFMFVQALNILFDRMKKAKFDFSSVTAISGTRFFLQQVADNNTVLFTGKRVHFHD
jgi:xylulokinase